HLFKTLASYIRKSPGTVSAQWRNMVQGRSQTRQPFLQMGPIHEDDSEEKRSPDRLFEKEVRTKGLNRQDIGATPKVLNRIQLIIDREPQLEGQVRKYILENPPSALSPKFRTFWAELMEGMLVDGKSMAEVRQELAEK